MAKQDCRDSGSPFAIGPQVANLRMTRMRRSALHQAMSSGARRSRGHQRRRRALEGQNEGLKFDGPGGICGHSGRSRRCVSFPQLRIILSGLAIRRSQMVCAATWTGLAGGLALTPVRPIFSIGARPLARVDESFRATVPSCPADWGDQMSRFCSGPAKGTVDRRQRTQADGKPASRTIGMLGQMMAAPMVEIQFVRSVPMRSKVESRI
jgi:hypothetical protein